MAFGLLADFEIKYTFKNDAFKPKQIKKNF